MAIAARVGNRVITENGTDGRRGGWSLLLAWMDRASKCGAMPKVFSLQGLHGSELSCLQDFDTRMN
jgi:hypothetical protein